MTTDDVRLDLLLDSLRDPLVYCDTEHVIRYMNAVAEKRYAGRPAAVGRSILECHNEESNAQILVIADRLAAGEEEVRIGDDGPDRVYVRGVRDPDGRFVGYYERREPIEETA